MCAVALARPLSRAVELSLALSLSLSHTHTQTHTNTHTQSHHHPACLWPMLSAAGQGPGLLKPQVEPRPPLFLLLCGLDCTGAAQWTGHPWMQTRVGHSTEPGQGEAGRSLNLVGIIMRNHPMADSTGFREGSGATRMHSTCRTHPQTRPHFFMRIPSGHIAKDLIISRWSQLLDLRV